jgi:hypothetical protein
MSELKDITNLEAEQDSGIGSLKNIIPPNIRMFMQDLVGSKDKFTEADLSKSDRDLLKEIALSAKDKGYIDYGDYKVDSINRNFLRNIVDDRYNLKTLLGKAKVELNDQGELVVKDTFDFNDKKDIKSLEDLKFALTDMKDAFLGKEGFAGTGGLYSLIREGARYVGSGPGEGAPVEINLGKLTEDQA